MFLDRRFSVIDVCINVKSLGKDERIAINRSIQPLLHHVGNAFASENVYFEETDCLMVSEVK